MNSELLYGGLAVLGIYQLYVTSRISSAAQYSRMQKFVQVTLVWLIPLIGAITCHAFLVSDTKPPRKRDGAFISDGGDSPHGAGSEGIHH
jgi:hypothetical protein